MYIQLHGDQGTVESAGQREKREKHVEKKRESHKERKKDERAAKANGGRRIEGVERRTINVRITAS